MIDYGNLMHDAMRSLIQRLLQDIAVTGKLPGDHHFFITFDTTHPDVEIADWLTERYPSEMTIVMQHWFDNLEVTDEGFSVTLNFGDNPEPLYIPFMSLRTFVDPSVEFGLKFEQQDDEEIIEADIKNIVVVTGYNNHIIEDHLKTIQTSIKIETAYNPDWELANGVSVLAAQNLIPVGEDFMISMSDHYYNLSLIHI